MAGIKNENYAKCKALLLGLIAASLVSLIFPWFPFPSESCALGQLVDAGGVQKMKILSLVHLVTSSGQTRCQRVLPAFSGRHLPVGESSVSRLACIMQGFSGKSLGEAPVFSSAMGAQRLTCL
jgi:hypothetical protein